MHESPVIYIYEGNGRHAPGFRGEIECVPIIAAVVAIGVVDVVHRVDGPAQDGPIRQGGQRRPTVGGHIVAGKRDFSVALMPIDEAIEIDKRAPQFEIGWRCRQVGPDVGDGVVTAEDNVGHEVEIAVAVGGDVACAVPQAIADHVPGVAGDVIDAHLRAVVGVDGVNLAVQVGRAAIVAAAERRAGQAGPEIGSGIVAVEACVVIALGVDE